MEKKFALPKKTVSLFVLFLLNFSLLFSQEIITASRYLELVAEVYGGIRDYEANITINSAGTEMTGVVNHLAPSLLRIDFSRPADQVIIFNGELLSIYLPELRAVLNQSINQSRAGGASLASAQGLTLMRRNYIASFVTGPTPEPLSAGSNEQVIKLRLTRSSVSEGFRELILSINPETRLIRRIEGRTIADVDVRFDFTNMRINQGIPEARFIYDSPASANMYNNFLFRDTD